MNKAGVYGFQRIATGEIVYIGSAINLWKRFLQHITGQKSNVILQNAFAKYCLASFRFLVFEILPSIPSNSTEEDRATLHETEKFYLDTFKPRYNILSTAGSTLGYKHTTESLAKMSGGNNPAYGRSGAMNPMFGRTGVDHPMYGVTGADHPNFGKVPANAKTVFV